MNVIPFRAEHLSQIDVQERQRRTVSYLTAKLAGTLERGGPAISGLVNDRIIGSGGILVHERTGFAWAVFAQDAAPYFIHMHHAARRLLKRLPKLERIEAVTEVDFLEGRRWLDLLGFECECPVRDDGLNGEDHFRYVLSSRRK